MATTPIVDIKLCSPLEKVLSDESSLLDKFKISPWNRNWYGSLQWDQKLAIALLFW